MTKAEKLIKRLEKIRTKKSKALTEEAMLLQQISQRQKEDMRALAFSIGEVLVQGCRNPEFRAALNLVRAHLPPYSVRQMDAILAGIDTRDS